MRLSPNQETASFFCPCFFKKRDRGGCQKNKRYKSATQHQPHLGNTAGPKRVNFIGFPAFLNEVFFIVTFTPDKELNEIHLFAPRFIVLVCV